MEDDDFSCRRVPSLLLPDHIDPYRILVEATKDYAIYLLDLAGNIMTWNAGAEGIKGYQADEIIGRHFSCFFLPEDIARGLPQQYLDQAIAQGKLEDEGWRVRKDGTRYWVNGVIAPLYDNNGKLFGFSKVLRDLSERHAQEQRLQEQRMILAGIIDTAMDGIITINENHQIIVFNRASEMIFQHPAAEAIGQSLNTFIPEQFPGHHTQLIQNFAHTDIKLRKMANPCIVYGVRTTGEEFPLEAIISQTEVGGRKQVTVILRDITDRLQAEQAIQERLILQERLTKQAEVFPGVLFSFRRQPDGTSSLPYISPAVEDVLGVAAEEVTDDASLILHQIHPDDSEGFNQNIAESTQQMTLWHNEYRYQHPQKGEIWLEGRSVPVSEPDGSTLWHGFAVDITERKQAEEKLRESQRYLKKLIESLPQIVWTADKDNGYTYISQQWFEYVGIHPTERVSQNWINFIHPDDLKQHQDLQQAMARGDSLFDTEYRLRRADGNYRWFNTRSVPFRDKTGEILKWIGTSTDIDDQKQTEVELRQWADAFKNCAHGIAIGNPATNQIIACNPAFAHMHRQAIEDVIHSLIFDLYDPADQEYIRDCIEVADLTGQMQYEARLQRKDGSTYDVQMDIVSVRDEGGQLRYRVATIQDITERKQAEAAIHESEARYRNLIEVSPDTILVYRESQVVFVNHQGLELFGADTQDQILGKSLVELIAPDYSEFIHQKVEETLFNNRSVKGVEEKIVRLDGRLVDVETVISPFSDQGKQAVLLVLRDITERKQSERRLLAQWQVSRILAEADSLNEATPQILQTLCQSEGWDFGEIWEVDKQARLLRCVETWAIDEPGLDALQVRTRNTTFAYNSGLPGKVWATEQPVQIREIAEDQDFLRANLALQAGLHSAFGFPIVHQGDVVGVLDFLHHSNADLDQSILAQLSILGSQIGQFLARKQAQEQVQQFVSASPAVIFALRLEGDQQIPVWTSDNIFDLTGYHSDEANETGWWVRHLHPEEKDRVLAMGAELERTGHQIVEYRFCRRDKTYFWMRDERRLLYDVAGQPIEIVGSWSDITDWVRLESQYRQSQKMEAIGQLAGGIAHDFNNLLTVIAGYSDLLLARLPANDPKRNFVANIKQAGETATSLTRQLLAFSRKQVLEPKVLGINDIVSNVEKMLRRLIGEDITLTSVLQPNLSKVKVDPGQLEQVIINLAVNARDAMPQGGQLTIETDTIELDRMFCMLHSDCKPGWYTRFSMTDTGCGMTPEVKSHIFEPFFTTKEQGKGTGLGLSTVFGIVKQSDGFIEVYSEVGIGTCFKLYLPAIEDLSPKSVETEWEVVRQGTELILLIEDEALVRTITRLSLESYGYQVIEAKNGDEAFTLTKTIASPIALLLTDIVMPKMNGRQVADHLQQRFPDLKVLFMSGYTNDAIFRHGIMDDQIAFIQKPFTPTALAKKVREVLDGK